MERMHHRNFRMRQLRVAEVFRLLLRVCDTHLTIMLAANTTSDSIPARLSSKQSLPERMIYWCAFSDCLRQRKLHRCRRESLLQLFPVASVLRSLFPVDFKWTSPSNLFLYIKLTSRGTLVEDSRQWEHGRSLRSRCSWTFGVIITSFLGVVASEEVVRTTTGKS